MLLPRVAGVPGASALLQRPVLGRADFPSAWALADLSVDGAGADIAGSSGGSDATAFVGAYVALLALLLGGIGWLVFQDMQAGQRKKEAIDARADMAEKLRAQGMEREAQILEAERAQMAQELDANKPKPVWEELANAAQRRSEAQAETASASSGPGGNRTDRREAAKRKRRDEKKQKKDAA